jgi:hypothetical protein
MAQQYPYKSPTHNNDNETDKEKDAKKNATALASQIAETRGATEDKMAWSDSASAAWPKVEVRDPTKDLLTGAANATGMDKATTTADVKDKAAASTKDKAAVDAKDKAADVKDVAVSKAIEVKDIVVEQATAVKDKAVEVKDKAVEVEQVVAEKAIELKDEAVEKLAEAEDVVVETLDDVGEKAKRWGREAWRFTSANAVPLAMIGIGTGLLLANSKRSSSEPSSPRLADHYDFDDELEEETLDASGVVSSTGAQRPSQPRDRVNARRSGKRAAARGFDST